VETVLSVDASGYSSQPSYKVFARDASQYSLR
jgi:hypothetical protein